MDHFYLTYKIIDSCGLCSLVIMLIADGKTIVKKIHKGDSLTFYTDLPSLFVCVSYSSDTHTTFVYYRIN